MRKIKVEDYDPKWAQAFEDLKKAYLEHIRKDLIVEHVGSTSVPGLAAKAIIDIDIIVKSEKEVKELIEALEDLGYYHQGNLGIEGREAFKRAIKEVPLLTEHHSKWYPHHLYVCLENSVGLKNHLAIRDYLLKNEEAVKEYSELKKELAHKYPHDIDSYISEKTPFLTKILEAAGLSDKEIKEVTDSNE